MNKFNLKNYKGGWKKNTTDSRDWEWDEIFGAVALGEEVLPDAFDRTPELPLYMPFQNGIPSCVLCSFAYIQGYKQKKELKREFELSWRFPWAFTPHTPTGSTFRDGAKTFQDRGTSSIIFTPDRPEMGYNWVEDPINITEEAKQDALFNRIKNYQNVSWLDFRRALYREPLIIAVGGNNATWNTQYVKDHNYIIDQKGMNDNNRQWAHAVVPVDYKKDTDGQFIYRIPNWWGKEWGLNGYAWLKNPDILAIISVEDLSNITNINYMMKLLKLKTKPTIFLTNEKLKLKQEIFSEADYIAITGKNPSDWSLIEEVDQAELDNYQTVGKILAFQR